MKLTGLNQLMLQLDAGSGAALAGRFAALRKNNFRRGKWMPASEMKRNL
jgi:hypothetical protein